MSASGASGGVSGWHADMGDTGSASLTSMWYRRSVRAAEMCILHAHATMASRRVCSRGNSLPLLLLLVLFLTIDGS